LLPDFEGDGHSMPLFVWLRFGLQSIPMICALVNRLCLMPSAPSRLGQTLHHGEGISGGQVRVARQVEAVSGGSLPRGNK
jgi:hypothetical protein